MFFKQAKLIILNRSHWLQSRVPTLQFSFGVPIDFTATESFLALVCWSGFEVYGFHFSNCSDFSSTPAQREWPHFEDSLARLLTYWKALSPTHLSQPWESTPLSCGTQLPQWFPLSDPRVSSAFAWDCPCQWRLIVTGRRVATRGMSFISNLIYLYWFE